MRQYLATLHTRSEAHKKRFAFLVSGGFTLIIFSIWSLATFGTGGTLAQNNQQLTTDNREQEVSPFASLRDGIAAGFAGLSEAFQGLTGGLKGAADYEANKPELKDETFNTYGR